MRIRRFFIKLQSSERMFEERYRALLYENLPLCVRNISRTCLRIKRICRMLAILLIIACLTPKVVLGHGQNHLAVAGGYEVEALGGQKAAPPPRSREVVLTVSKYEIIP